MRFIIKMLVGTGRFDHAVLEVVYRSQGSVMCYFGPDASRPITLGVASAWGFVYGNFTSL